MKKAIQAANIAVIITTSLIALAPAARADQQDYHDYLQSHGVPPAPTSQWEHFDAAGRFMCTEMRNGMTPEQIVSQYTGGYNSHYINPYDGGFIRPYAQMVVDAAQYNMCPDTIR
jgi:hypothetical protein